MKKTKAIAVMAMMMSPICAAQAQNPIIHHQFSADPTARVFDGRIYLFPSHDIISPVEPEKKWFSMADYHVFSSDNLTDWTDHGVILSQEQVTWGNPTAYSMWAPDCVEKDGKYYFFFPDAPKPLDTDKDGRSRGFGVGVAVADHPYGPYRPEPNNIKGIAGIDPCVLQASNGENVIFWGGGGLRMARLKDNLTELADEELQNPVEGPHGMKLYGHAVEGLPEGFKEGPFAFERNGKFYLTYPWVRKENGTECLAYAMSDKPMGPYEYKGIIMKEHENGCWTNHHSIVEYKGQWYLFYHNNAYSPWFDKNRSVCADSLFFNPDGTIQEVKPTLRGIGVTDARTMVQMDRYSSIGGGATIEYNDTTNRFLGWKTILPKDGFVTYANVQIPEGEYTVWVNKPGFWGRAEIVDIKQTSLNLKVNRQPNGLHELVLTNKGEAPVEVDWISLNPRRPLVPSSAGGIATGTYRNLFVEAGHSEAEVEAKLREVFDDVFKGKHRCYFEVGKDMAYISDIKNNDVRSEGMSYGMMIAVQFDRKDIFDRLWRWTKKYMQMQDGAMKGYFRWSCKRDGTPNAHGPASDGELYYITSLIFASNRWGNSGEIDYLKEAQYILDCIQPRETEVTMHRGEDGKKLEKPINVKRTISLIDPATSLITFVPGAAFTDPSYHIPAFYEVWARYADDGRASYWRECARKSREYLHKSVHPMTGLNDDYNNFDGTPLHNNRLLGDCFRYDSWRVPMNIALDYSWACSDRQWQQNYGHTIQNFFFSQGIDSYLDQYNTDGTLPKQILPAGTYQPKLRHSIGLMATLAASSIMCSHPKSYDFIDRLWNAKHKPDADGYFDAYYDGLLRLFAFMHLSGHYRVIEKTPQLETYLRPATKDSTTPDSEGFVRRWMLHDPISKPNRSNTVFTDTYLNETFPQPLAYSKKDKAWNAYDSQLFNVKLYRLATCTGQQRYGVIFWATTIIECDEEIKDVRFAIGSNSASKWWLNGQEMAMLSGDRRMVRDDVVSRPVTLKKGRNIITGAVINGPGMSDFCFRIVDADKYNLRITTAFR
mgnify:FL=1